MGGRDTVTRTKSAIPGLALKWDPKVFGGVAAYEGFLFAGYLIMLLDFLLLLPVGLLCLFVCARVWCASEEMASDDYVSYAFTAADVAAVHPRIKAILEGDRDATTAYGDGDL